MTVFMVTNHSRAERFLTLESGRERSRSRIYFFLSRVDLWVCKFPSCLGLIWALYTQVPLYAFLPLFCFSLTDANAAHWICTHRFRSWKWRLMCYMSYDVNLIFPRGQWFNLRFIFLYTLARSQDSVLNRLPATPRKQTPHSASLCCYSIFL